MLVTLDALYPEYGFAAHKGYGTAAHLRALQQFGALPEHRRSFAPVAKALERTPNSITP
jgi:ribonuclease HII